MNARRLSTGERWLLDPLRVLGTAPNLRCQMSSYWSALIALDFAAQGSLIMFTAPEGAFRRCASMYPRKRQQRLSCQMWSALGCLVATGMLISVLTLVAQAQGQTQELRVVTRKASPIVRMDQGELSGFAIEIWNS